MAPLRDYSMQNEEKLNLSTDIDGHTRGDDDDADMRDNYLGDNLCEDCWEEDTGYCRCLVWDWGRENGLMIQQQVFALFRQEKVQERAERAQRQTTRKARVNLSSSGTLYAWGTLWNTGTIGPIYLDPS